MWSSAPDSRACLLQALTDPGRNDSARRRYQTSKDDQLRRTLRRTCTRTTSTIPPAPHVISTRCRQSILMSTGEHPQAPHAVTGPFVEGSGGNPFVCNICHKTYGRIDHLARHFRSRKLLHLLARQPDTDNESYPDTNEKPFKCLECGKTFARAYVKPSLISALSAPGGPSGPAEGTSSHCARLRRRRLHAIETGRNVIATLADNRRCPGLTCRPLLVGALTDECM